MSHATPHPPAARFARLIAALCDAVAARVIGPARPGLAGPLVILIWSRLQRIAGRIARLAARAEAGRLRPPRPRPAASRRPPSPPYQRLPRGAAWLIRAVPAAASAAGQLEALLADPATRTLIEAAPQIGRTLRPLCRMLGVSLPPALRLPPQATASRPRPAEPPRAEPPPPLRPPPAPEVANPAFVPPLPA